MRKSKGAPVDAGAQWGGLCALCLNSGSHIFARDVTVVHCQRVRHAAHSGNIVNGESLALSVAGNVEAGNDFVVLVENMTLFVAYESHEGGKINVHAALECVEGAVLDGEHTICRLAEVEVFAIAGKLVIALDGRFGCRYIGEVFEFRKELVDGFPFDDAEGPFCLAGLFDGVSRNVGVYIVDEQVFRRRCVYHIIC